MSAAGILGYPLGGDPRLLGGADVLAVTAGPTYSVPMTHALHSITITANVTLTFDQPPADAWTMGVYIAGAFTVTLPSSVKWSGGSAATYTTPALYIFQTFDRGVTWLASQAGKAYA